MRARTIWYNPTEENRHALILFKPENYWQRHASGVYKITFGNRFYIGMTCLLYKRYTSHYRNINRALPMYPFWRQEDYNYYEKIVRYLHENPKVKVGYIELIHQCEDYFEMVYMEGKYLNDNRNNPDCLNVSFNQAAIPTKREIPTMISMRVYEHYRWFYNPEYDQELIEWDELTTNGGWKQHYKKSASNIDTISFFQRIVNKWGIIH